MKKESLAQFSPSVSEWFSQTLGKPTRTQDMGWPVIQSGQDALICAPTGTGKTLCAFLPAIDGLYRKALDGELDDGVRVLYISPLKALGNDIARNLERPLEGIGELDGRIGAVRKAIRTGDTPANERRRMATKPPHILITTPESLYLLLTSKAGASMFAKLETVIVDEIHALLESKRGTHLALSLARLSKIRPFQRIGLTATVEPLQEAADFLGMEKPVTIVDARTPKRMDVLVQCPADGFFGLPEGTIWPEIAASIVRLIRKEPQVLVFCNNRATTENVAAAINRNMGEDVASTHHGSMDKERRLIVEEQFKNGELRCLCATSSMELGIDIGAVSIVVQVASPVSSARGLQRLGRSGHSPGQTSRMRMLPRMPEDALDASFVARSMLEGIVEPMKAPRLCADVLAQHIVSMSCTRDWTLEEILELAHGTLPYQDLTREELESTLRMLRGDFEHQAGRDFRPRIIWNERDDTVSGDVYGRMLATMGGTIPDRGYYAVVTAEGTRLGELDEEFVFEARIGDRFRLGAFTWAVTRIQHDRVVVAPSSGAARSPFWKGEVLGRPSRTGEMYGRELAFLEAAPRMLEAICDRYPTDEPSARAVANLLGEQMRRLGCLPTDKRVVVEHFQDEAGECFVALHCPLGGRVNQPLAMGLRDTVARLTGRGVQVYHGDDGIMLHLIGDEEAPKGLLQLTQPSTLTETILRDLTSTPVFSIRFREAAAVALVIGGRRTGNRVPLWVQRLRGAEALSRAAQTDNHPLVVEAYRSIMDRAMEIPRAVQLLEDIHSGAVDVVEVRTDVPSPMTKALRDQLIGVYTYVEAIPQEVVSRGALAQPQVVAPVAPQAERMEQRAFAQPKDADGLYTYLMRRGTLPLRDWAELGGALLVDGRGASVNDLLVAAHEKEALCAGLSGDAQALAPFLMRYVRMQGEMGEEIHDYFAMDVQEGIDHCLESGELVMYRRGNETFYATPERVTSAIAQAARERMEQVKTEPAAHYAALLPGWQKAAGDTPAAHLADGIAPLFGLMLEPSLWEDVILPARIRNYKPKDLDQALLTGELMWRVQDGKVAFYPPEQPCLAPLAGDENDGVHQALLAGGAQFIRQISTRSGVSGAALLRRLNELAAAGLAVCDGFNPLRRMVPIEDAKRRARARAMELSGEGRWEAASPVAPLSIPDQLEMLFDRWAVVGRECAAAEGLAWPPLLEELRLMEYRDQVRRGYFVKGLSGAQFVRTRQFSRVCGLLAAPEGDYVLSAADPAQPYGSILENAGVLCVPGNALVLIKGVPVLAAERRGERLRLLGDASQPHEALDLFVQAFMQKRLWPNLMRITVKEWPEGAAKDMQSLGFRTEMMDMSLWRM